MKAKTSLVLAAFSCLTACSAYAPEPPQEPAARSARPKTAPPPALEGRDYVVLERVRFFDDKGYIQPVEAFSALVPKGWRSEGGVRWKSPFACAGETYAPFLNITSPDGGVEYRSLPMQSWGYTSDPAIREQMQMMAQQGGCAVAPAMGAEQYLREVLAPRELGNPRIVSVEPNQEVIRELLAKSQKYQATAASMGMQLTFRADAVLARLEWPGGQEGVALTTVLNSFSSMANPYTGGMQQSSTSVAGERSVLRFPAARRQEAEKFLATLRTSYRTNPDWERAIEGFSQQMRNWRNQNHDMVMRQLEANRQQMMASHAERMAAIRQQGAAGTAAHQERMNAMDRNMRSWEAAQSSSDRMHTAFVQSIRGVETWRGEGGAVELTAGYENAWTRGDGTFVLSNKPGFDPAAVFQDQAWRPLRRGN